MKFSSTRGKIPTEWKGGKKFDRRERDRDREREREREISDKNIFHGTLPRALTRINDSPVAAERTLNL